MTKFSYLIICILFLFSCRNLEDLCYDHCDCESIHSESKCNDYVCCDWIFDKHYTEAGIDKGSAGCECNGMILEEVSKQHYSIDTSKTSFYAVDIDGNNNTFFITQSKISCDNNFESEFCVTNSTSIEMFGQDKQFGNDIFFKECDVCNSYKTDIGDNLFKDLYFEELSFENTYIKLSGRYTPVYFETSELRGVIHFLFDDGILNVDISYLYEEREHDVYYFPSPLRTKCNVTLSLPSEISLDGRTAEFYIAEDSYSRTIIKEPSPNYPVRFNTTFQTSSFLHILNGDDIPNCSDKYCRPSKGLDIYFFRTENYKGVICNYRKNEDGTVSFDIKYTERW